MQEFERALWAYIYPTNENLRELVYIARFLRCDAIIAKCGNGATFYNYQSSQHVPWQSVVYAVKANGFKLGAEIYAYGRKPEAEGQVLARACREGADFAVVNAEVEWEGTTYTAGRVQSYENAIRLVRAFRDAKPAGRIYACVDTRGSRPEQPYQKGFVRAGIDGWMPMVYPEAFYPDHSFGFIQRTFDECFKTLHSAPYYPVIQMYGGMDYQDTLAQIILCWRYACEGVGLYVAHNSTARGRYGVSDAPPSDVYEGKTPSAVTYTRDEILAIVERAF